MGEINTPEPTPMRAPVCCLALILMGGLPACSSTPEDDTASAAAEQEISQALEHRLEVAVGRFFILYNRGQLDQLHERLGSPETGFMDRTTFTRVMSGLRENLGPVTGGGIIHETVQTVDDVDQASIAVRAIFPDHAATAEFELLLSGGDWSWSRFRLDSERLDGPLELP